MSHAMSQLKKSVTPEMLSAIAKTINEPEGSVSKALSGTFSVILSGITKRLSSASSSDELLGQLAGLIKNAPSKEQLSANPSNLLNTLKGQGDLTASAGNFISLIFGNKLQDFVSLVAKWAGISPTSASSLFQMAGPMVMGWLGHRMQEDDLPISKIGSYLTSQADLIDNDAPEGLGNLWGLIGLSGAGAAAVGAAKSAIASTQTNAAKLIEKESRSYLIPILIIGALLLGALFMWKSCSSKDKGTLVTEAIVPPAQVIAEPPPAPEPAPTPEPVVVSPPAVTTPAVENPWAHLGIFGDVKLPSGISLNLPELGIENKLLAFIQDSDKQVDTTTWFSFDRLLFETGSATLKSDSNEQLANIAEILKAFPNVNIKIGGYTDNTGTVDGNLKLSQHRAENVRQALIDRGIDASRIEAEGYGQEHPVATNDTEEGRAQNRRIDVRVTQK